MLNKLKSVAKNLLADRRVRNTYNRVTQGVMNAAGSNRVGATVYTGVGFATFNREQYAVVRGRRAYFQNLKRAKQNHVALRRNVHRLEKGLVMQPRRPVFALDYIDETMDFYEVAASQFTAAPDTVDESEMRWAHDVLAMYFDNVNHGNSLVASAFGRYESANERLAFTSETGRVKAPFTHTESHVSDISYEQMLDLAQRRRSVRWFDGRPVPRDLIDKALMGGRQAPSACNRLPYEFRIFDDPDMVKKVAGIPFGTGGYSHQIPAIAVVVGKLDHYFSPRDRHAIYVDSSLATMSFIFGLETLGVSSTIINWPDFEPLEIRMQKELGLDPSERVIMLVAMGFAAPEGGIPFSQKKSIESTAPLQRPSIAR